MREIAREATTTSGTLHHYFGNKKALHQACVDEMYARVAQLQTHMVQQLSTASSASDLLSGAVRSSYRLARDNRDAVRLVQRAVLDQGESSEPQRAQAVTRFLDTAVALVEPLSSLGASECRSMLYAFMLLVNRVALLEHSELARVWPEGDVEDQLVSASERMLGLRPG